jgi:hypothetical protein
MRSDDRAALIKRLNDLAPACRDHAGNENCNCWLGIQMAIGVVHAFGRDD